MTVEGDLVIRDLSKAFGDHQVLHDLCLTVPAGSVTAVLGASGSGKTTLLRMIAGFERPDRGTIAIGTTQLDGEHAHVQPSERRIGYVAQEGNLFPHLDVTRNVGFGLPWRERRGPKVASLLDAVGLGGLGHRYPHQLSGGQQQRVALARSLAVGARAVLLDEPFNTLDANLRASVRSDVHDILRQAAATAVLVTHDQDEALLMSDFVAVIRDGMIAQFASPTELYDLPVDPELACFVGDANMVRGDRDGDLVRTPFGRHRLRNVNGPAFSGEALVMIRPEAFALSEDLEGPGLAGRVLDVEFHGPQTLLRVAVADARVLGPVLVRRLGAAPIGISAAVRLTVDGGVCAWPFETAGAPQPRD